MAVLHMCNNYSIGHFQIWPLAERFIDPLWGEKLQLALFGWKPRISTNWLQMAPQQNPSITSVKNNCRHGVHYVASSLCELLIIAE